jgi:hypothetical protein
MNVPVLKDFPPVRVGMDRAGIGMPSRCLPAMHLLLHPRRLCRLLKNMIAVFVRFCGCVDGPNLLAWKDAKRVEPMNVSAVIFLRLRTLPATFSDGGPDFHVGKKSRAANTTLAEFGD